ncbi:MAG: PIN domain-containing protein [Halobaculum sp.]
MILDTSFLIDVMSSDRSAMNFADKIDGRGVPLRLPVQVLYELYVGVGYSQKPEAEREQIQSVVESYPTVETTDRIAKVAGRIDGELRAEGERVGANDILIGATARQYHEPVVTGNPEDFERIPEVSVRTYRQ